MTLCNISRTAGLCYAHPVSDTSDQNLPTTTHGSEPACSLENEGLFNPAKSRIKVFEFEHGKTSVPYTCTQCEEAWCLHACPTNAIVHCQLQQFNRESNQV